MEHKTRELKNCVYKIILVYIVFTKNGESIVIKQTYQVKQLHLL